MLPRTVRAVVPGGAGRGRQLAGAEVVGGWARSADARNPRSGCWRSLLEVRREDA